MIIQFKDRKRELKELDDILSKEGFEFIVIYGRRRVGKTELILNATEKTNRIYYLAVGEKNLDRFYDVCINHYPEAAKLKKDWEVLFDFLRKKSDVVIIDEFQNMIKEDSNILHIFQSITDSILKDSNQKLFLLGSSISIITSKLLDYKSPLYGRRTGSIELKPVSFFDMKEFFKDLDTEKLLNIYGFADGIPHYLIKIEGDFWKWLGSELQKHSTFLKDEIEFLMRYEFEDSGTYKLILEAIANGKTKLNEINDFIKLKRTDISPYLRNLIEVRMVKRTVPITENIKSRKGRYYLADNFLQFWFKFIYPNLSSIEEGILDIADIKSRYNQYLGKIFEDVSREFIIRQKKFSKVGSWWHKDKEIDIVALDEQKKEMLFAECKWQDNVDAVKILKELKEKSSHVQWNNNERKERYAIFAKSFKKKIKDVSLFDLKDFEKVFSK
ncbi:AAA family ATPase [Candidatus Woesearchaeota archaeon]|nr:AAA family ATPase [Candidatus Woesearchaeota archaeon]